MDEPEVEAPEYQHRGGARDGAEPGQQERQREGPEDDPRGLEQLHPVRPPEKAPGQQTGRDIGVLFHAGEHRAERRDAQVVDRGGRGSQEDDPVPNRVGPHPPGEDVHGREVAEGARGPRVVDQHAVARVDGHRDRAHREGMAEIELDAAIGHSHRQPGGLHRERRVVVAAILDDERLPARGPVGIGDHVGVAEVAGGRAEPRDGQADAARRQWRVLSALGIVAEAHERRLERQPRGLGRGGGRGRDDLEHRGEHDATALANRLLEPAVVVRLLDERVHLLVERLADAAER